ncbi:hypothetical protein Pint_05492 [Pistacia integerrima]|uniref:Uncharacterized protein n=1 Tax=Pistacia integerrima TaxID=434235 RepID=A0ACC0Z9W1_9ROSI|nr:hypothetical protein Pint_05492 [Pistacia integerrima]
MDGNVDPAHQCNFVYLFRLAASIAVEEHESLTDNESIPAGSIPFKEEDGDEDEEMILMSVAKARKACQSQYEWIKEALDRLVEQLTSQ